MWCTFFWKCGPVFLDQVACSSTTYERNVPVPCNFDLNSMCSEELNIEIRVAEKGQDKTPGFRTLLDIKQLLLQAALVF